MRKSLLNLCLQKVAEGDESFFDRLCQQLADRLIFAAVASGGENQGGAEGRVTFSIVRMQEGHRLVVPIFTSEELYKTWEKATGHRGGSISLLGADFCAALDAQTWIRVDPGSNHCVELQPVLVKKVARVEVDELEASAENVQSAELVNNPEQASVTNAAPTVQAKQTAPSSKLLRQALFQTDNPDEGFIDTKQLMHTPEPVVPQEKAAQASPAAEVQTGRLASAALFQEQAKVGEAKPKIIRSKTTGDTTTTEVEMPRSTTSTTMNRPVIRSSALQSPQAPAQRPEDARGKKKSFLKFLKGS
ncbi:MAG: SseB family protein [Oligoflexia bacterium]|nr:SseB family protein [Oligoflexia bacterium]